MQGISIGFNIHLSRRRRIFVGLSFIKTFFHNFPVTTTDFAEIPILKALELGKIEVVRDIWAYTALEKTLDRTNLKTVWKGT